MDQNPRLTCLKRLFAALIAIAPVMVQAAGAVHEFTLDNGLKLLVKEDHRAPVVVSQVWYKVGASYEHDGITGLSHVLEHMMFKGTKAHPGGEFSRIIAENGGDENAFTSRDYTAYFQRLERSRLPVSFELEADRMRNLLVNDEEAAKETKVVMEERRLRTDDDPVALTWERLNAVAFLSSSRRIPVIGWMEDLESLQTEDLRAWYQRWYAPNNAIVVVVGDVDPQAVFKLAKKYFGPLKPSKIEPTKPRREIAQTDTRRITVRVPAEVPQVFLAYKVPVLTTAAVDWEPYAIEVLAGLLDGGASARLAREIVRGAELAVSADVSYDLFDRQEGMLVLNAAPAPGVDIDKLELALRAQIKRLQDEPVTDSELRRVQAQVVADHVYEQDSHFYQGMQMGIAECVGLGWQVINDYVPKVRAVTTAQVQAVAKKYLHQDSLTIAVLEPVPRAEGEKPRPVATGAGHAH